MTNLFDNCLAKLPLVAILRGLLPEEAIAVGRTLVDAGFTILEVPLNSPNPLKSIELMTSALGDHVLIGAGTVLSVGDVHAVKAAGGRLIVAPNMDQAVIGEAKRQGMIALPGIMTPTEAFAALGAGADGLKLFPAEMIPPKMVGAMRAVLPKSARLFAVGGVTEDNMAAYVAAGVDGFGIGSSLYKPGKSLDSIDRDARSLVAAFHNARQSRQGVI